MLRERFYSVVSDRLFLGGLGRELAKRRKENVEEATL